MTSRRARSSTSTGNSIGLEVQGAVCRRRAAQEGRRAADRIIRTMVESADRVLRLLEAFAPHERDVSLAEIAERVALPKSSAHRLLATLVAHGFVERDPATRRYRLGIRLFELGSAAIHERGLHSSAHPVLEQLTQATG